MAPARDGEVPLFQHDCARVRNESLGLCPITVIPSHDFLEIAQAHEGGVINGAEWSKAFAHIHSTLGVFGLFNSAASLFDQTRLAVVALVPAVPD
jgi:hypothetical protein